MKFFKKTLRILSWIIIIINTLIIIGFYFLGASVLGSYDNTNSAFSIVLEHFSRTPFDFSNYDVSFVWLRIIMYLIPILILSFVKNKKSNKLK
ncbi:hypothetical protein ABLU29_09830 [Lactococcus lactis]|uniref:hypothetical protein n=1 Tax=Lactococcus lactis TaxID=1358 RepID=UPI003877FA28